MREKNIQNEKSSKNAEGTMSEKYARCALFQLMVVEEAGTGLRELIAPVNNSSVGSIFMDD